jgi:hypothetical protein
MNNELFGCVGFGPAGALKSNDFALFISGDVLGPP